MTTITYKVLPAPARARKIKGGGTAEDRFADTLSEVLNTQAQDGWEFLRAETLPSEERAGLTGTRNVFRTMLVFRRAIDISEDQATREALRLLEDRS
ncbi:hypothetical protein [Pseudoruegeria sp. SK021]|uniref:hypothetical protein n=1 Tax=Pseudoruegeria sp. SK021 TaxID=1933035 RepID=UPI000A216504|nr:hypothetical protein [Pseudoruegeria sp. SK021]OSP56409.1 hypothetical protein BV911_00085 [Pseudoruegeria sp. SK021]